MKRLTIITISSILFCVQSKVTVTQFESCQQKDYDIKFGATVKDVGDKQYIDGFLKNRVPLDNNVMIYFTIFSSLTGNNYRNIFTIKERVCSALKNYIGQFGYDLQRAAQLSPGQCPIPPGNYSVHNYELDFTKFKLKTFPFGNLKFKTYMNDVNTNKTQTCLDIAITSKPI